ncbi:MAG: EamA family transporter [Armatimonadetes bacterium]|nr:EamA family transporter [Armatimonadota bacterium]
MNAFISLTWRGHACALGAAALWAVSAALAKGLFSGSLDVFSVAQTRALVGFLFLWPALLLFRRPLARLAPREVPFMALVGANFVLIHASYYYAISLMPVAVAILIQYMAPLLILAWVRGARRRPVEPTLWAAALLCLAGCALVAGVSGDVGGIGARGLAAGVVSAITYAAYILLAESGVRRFSPWTILCYGLGFAALFWGVLRPWWRFPYQALTPGTAGLLVFIAVMGTVLAFGLVSVALRYLPAGPVGITTTAEPVIAAGVAFIHLHEHLTATQLAGGALVLAGILLSHRVPAGEAAPEWHGSRRAEEGQEGAAAGVRGTLRREQGR